MGSWQAATGASLSVIGKSLGHLNQGTTAIYARLDLDPVRQAVDKAAAAMLTAGQAKRPKTPKKEDKGNALKKSHRGTPAPKPTPEIGRAIYQIADIFQNLPDAQMETAKPWTERFWWFALSQPEQPH